MLHPLHARSFFSLRSLGAAPLTFAVLAALTGCAQGTTIGEGGSGGSGGSFTTSPSGTTNGVVTTGSSPAQVTSGGPTTPAGPGVTTGATSVTTAVTTVTNGVTTGSGMSPPGTLFFSEYVEGSSNNKALEIVNAGPTSVSLAGCQIDRYQNGATTASPPIVLTSVTLASGEVFVVCHTSFAQPGLCDQLSGSVQHTGNDVVGLSCNGNVMDIFGRIGEDMVWGTAPTSSMDSTLRRKCSVLVGDENGTDAFDPATQWDGFPADTFSDLGQYNCP